MAFCCKIMKLVCLEFVFVKFEHGATEDNGREDHVTEVKDVRM